MTRTSRVFTLTIALSHFALACSSDNEQGAGRVAAGGQSGQGGRTEGAGTANAGANPQAANGQGGSATPAAVAGEAGLVEPGKTVETAGTVEEGGDRGTPVGGAGSGQPGSGSGGSSASSGSSGSSASSGSSGSSASSGSSGSSASSGSSGSSAGSGGSDAGSTLSSVDTWITGGVGGAACYRLDGNEGLFAGYPFTKNIAVPFGASAYVGTLFGSSLLNWAAFKSSDCTGIALKSGVAFVPYKPGELSQWTVILK